jgi:hypothetical protein
VKKAGLQAFLLVEYRESTFSRLISFARSNNLTSTG